MTKLFLLIVVVVMAGCDQEKTTFTNRAKLVTRACTDYSADSIQVITNTNNITLLCVWDVTK